MDMLALHHVSKSFGGKQVLQDLTFTVPEHAIYGFIGQNGAGKTTAMKIILGLLKQDGGEVLVNGEPVRYGQTKTNRFIGYLSDVPEFYGYMTPLEYLSFCGQITGVPKKELHIRSTQLLDLVGLKENRKRIQGFSRGMKQRLGIAQALLNRPKLLICDEPTSALDPIGRKEILDILASVKKDATIIFSTHILSDVERICDEIAFLHQGKIALHGTMEEIRKKRKETGFLVECNKPEDVALLISHFGKGEKAGETELLYKGGTEQDMVAVMAFLAEHKLPVQRIEMLEPTLESLFVEVVGK